MNHCTYLSLTPAQQKLVRILGRRTKPTTVTGHQLNTATALISLGIVTATAVIGHRWTGRTFKPQALKVVLNA